jgi:hypothetical protein
MRKQLLVLLALFAFSANLFSAELPKTKEPNAKDVMIPLMYSDKSITLEQFVKLTPSAYKELTGKKLGFKHHVEMKVTQRQLKKTIRKDGTVDVTELQKVAAEPFKFHLGGFALGFLLGLLGVIITLFFKDANKKSRLYSSLIGLGAVIILVLLL